MCLLSEDHGIEVCGSKSSKRSGSSAVLSTAILQKTLEPIIELQKQNKEKMNSLQGQLLVLNRRLPDKDEADGPFGMNRDVFMIAIVLLIQLIMFWLFK